MGLEFQIHTDRRVPEEQAILLAEEALVSANPPLQANALKAIEAAKQTCLEGTTGAEQYEANAIFELIDRLPPIHGASVVRLLQHLVETNFSAPALRRYFDEMNNVPHPYSKTNEFGFIAKQAEVLGQARDVNVNIDVKRAEAETGDTDIELIGLLVSISDPKRRSQMIESCCLILQMRLKFQFS